MWQLSGGKVWLVVTLMQLGHECVLCVSPCLVSWSPASWSCHPFSSVFCISYTKEKQRVPSSFSLFFPLSFPHSTGQSWEINRNKLYALQPKPSLQKAVEAREAKELTNWRRDRAGQVEDCKQEPIWQLEAAHIAHHQHKFKIGQLRSCMMQNVPLSDITFII